MLNLCEPHAFVGKYLGRRKSHRGYDVRDILKQRMGKDRHEADLGVGKLQHVTNLWRTAEQNRFHPHCFFHCTLVGEFVLQKMCPFLGHSPWSSLLNLVARQLSREGGNNVPRC